MCHWHNHLADQLLPIYNKPMVYYPLSVLMLAGIREVAVITTPDDQPQLQRLLGDGSQWGLQLSFITQPEPAGLAQAYILAEEFLAGGPSAMVLGDNIFFGKMNPNHLQARICFILNIIHLLKNVATHVIEIPVQGIWCWVGLGGPSAFRGVSKGGGEEPPNEI